MCTFKLDFFQVLYLTTTPNRHFLNLPGQGMARSHEKTACSAMGRGLQRCCREGIREGKLSSGAILGKRKPSGWETERNHLLSSDQLGQIGHGFHPVAPVLLGPVQRFISLAKQGVYAFHQSGGIGRHPETYRHGQIVHGGRE